MLQDRNSADASTSKGREKCLKRPLPISGSDAMPEFQKRPKMKPSDSSLETGSRIGVSHSNNNTRLLLLQRLVREISNDPSLAAADSEVLEALLKLDGILDRAEILRPSKDVMTDDVQKLHLTNRSSTVTSGSSGPFCPPIMDEKLELAVFTHPALSSPNNATYDRLEILGDAHIELIATKLIWERFPDLAAGRISQIRETLVKNETLSGFAELCGFDRRILVPSNYDTPSKRWTKIKGDVFEAYVAALILSDPVCGCETASHWLASLWMPILEKLGPQKGELRSKETLAKKIMGKNVKLEYIEERPSIQQKGGTQTFFVALYLTGWGWVKRFLGSGQGLSKAAAGDEAAKEVLLNTPLVLEIMSAKQSWGSNSEAHA